MVYWWPSLELDLFKIFVDLKRSIYLIVLNLFHLCPVPPVDVLDRVTFEDARLVNAADNGAEDGGVASGQADVASGQLGVTAKACQVYLHHVITAWKPDKRDQN